MSEHGAVLQTYNQELVKCLEELKNKRQHMYEIVQRETAERMVLEKNLLQLQEKMNQLNGTLLYHKEQLNQYDNTIQDIELGFRKILESSQTLLQVVQQESSKLGSVNEDSDGSNFYSSP